MDVERGRGGGGVGARERFDEGLAVCLFGRRTERTEIWEIHRGSEKSRSSGSEKREAP